MTDPRITALQAAVDAGTATGDFPTSLLDQYARRGFLSEKQWPHVERLAAPQQQLASTTAMATIIAAFDAARQHKKFPVLRIKAGEQILRLAIATERSRYAGAVNVTSNERDYENRVWFGRINLDGTFARSRDTTPEITTALEAFALDPLAAAAAYGQATHSCCFCGIELRSKPSVAAGYGPICAGKWGLAWGEPKKTRKQKKEAA